MEVEVKEREGWKETRDELQSHRPDRPLSYVQKGLTSPWKATITGLLWGCSDCGSEEEYGGNTEEEVVNIALSRLIDIRDTVQEAIAKLLKMKKEKGI